MMASDCFTSRGETSAKYRKHRAMGLFRGPFFCPKCGVWAWRISLEEHIAKKHPPETKGES